MDSIRGILALLIVWHHLAPEMQIPYRWDFGNTIVLFFFVLSGFHICINWKNRLRGSYKDFIIRRSSNIFPIQWLTTILFVLFGINVVSYWAIPFHLTLTQSIIPLWEINFTLNTPSWFMSSIFFCYLLAIPILRFAVKNNKGFMALWLCAVIVFSLMLLLLPDTIGRKWLSYINPFARLLDFSAGILLGVLWNRGGNRRRAKLFYTVVELMFIIIFIIAMVYKPLFALNQYAVLRYPIVLGFIVIFTISKGHASTLLKNRFGKWLGSISMSVYMTHLFILHFTKDMQTLLWLKVLTTYVLVLISCYLLHRYVLPYVQGSTAKLMAKVLKR